MRKVSTTVPAPADMSVEVIGVPEGRDIKLDMRLESVMDGVLVSGTATVPLAGECVRCLEPLTEFTSEFEFQELYFYPDSEAEDGDLRLNGDLFDFEPVLRDAVVLALPLQPVCDENCPGLCVDCGVPLAQDPEHTHGSADPRWSALTGIFGGAAAEGDDSGATRADENQEK
jgi:uncharacterized protein